MDDVQKMWDGFTQLPVIKVLIIMLHFFNKKSRLHIIFVRTEINTFLEQPNVPRMHQ